MPSPALRFGARKLREALLKLESGKTRHEGLYAAFVDDIQWLADMDEDFPDEIRSAIAGLNQLLTRMPGDDRVSRARATISQLTPREAEALANLVVLLVRWVDAVDSRVLYLRD